ncbi:Chromosome partition protein SMC [[Mycoplasma] cavipharyngis]|uniref:AAA family ATPase n=1 Tax=[Mycoplasma] cavipharyngis TaxID=92757 RepID=UPI0037041F00
MFLKRFESRGFKSFADLTIIDFTNNMTGIVGPNGSGKSNIVDGLKWVLGEQSLKQLRGKHNIDFIFSGSDAREPANFAEVSLTFDNSNHVLKSDLKEIIITRRLTRGTNKNEYFINHEPVLLNQIRDIFLDSGLTKHSLGIISQGTVSWFTEAKPIERRKIFENAAEIGKYTQLKKSIINQLNQTKIELSKAEISLKEVNKQVEKLSQQAEKAKIYLDKKEQLKRIEVTILAQDILEYRNSLKAIEKDLNTKLATYSHEDQEIQTIKQKLILVKQRFNEIDSELYQDNQLMLQLSNQCNQLENQKNNYENELQQQLSSDNVENKIIALKQFITNLNLEIKELNFAKDKIETELSTFETIDQQLNHSHEKILRDLNTINNQFQQKQQEKYHLQDQLTNKFRNEYGIKAILSAKNTLTGIYDVLGNLINVEPQHENAISLALAKAVKNIVVDCDDDAKKAIAFLKANKAGTATFLPINNLRIRTMPEHHYEILNQLDNFVGLASELVSCQEKFLPVINALLGRIIIATDLEAALVHKRYTDSAYRIITLDGDQISAGGSISGGYNKTRIRPDFNIEAKIQEIDMQLLALQDHSQQLNDQAAKNKLVYDENHAKISNCKNQLILIKSQIEQNTNKLNNYQWEYEKYQQQINDPENVDQKQKIESLLTELIEKKQRLEQQRLIIDSNIKIKNNLSLDIQNYEFQLENLNDAAKKNNEAINDLQLRQTRINSVLESNTNRLMEAYQYTVEYAIEHFSQPLEINAEAARLLIRKLSTEIKNIGNINFKAAEELANLEKDFKYKQEQFNIIKQAVSDLENSLEQLNQKAKADFDHIIKSTNQKLPEIFHYLFGGGSCEVVYDDPNNILECGIEIHAHLPGKTITNLMLFSGGEKTLVALAVLFSVLQVSAFPLVILDEAESALDPANVERFGQIIQTNCDKTQFIIITHRNGTMESCESLFGVTMMIKGISKIIPVELKKAIEYAESETNN